MVAENREERLAEIKDRAKWVSNLDDLNSANATFLAEEDVPRLLELLDEQQFYFNQLTEAHNEACDLRWKFEQQVQVLQEQVQELEEWNRANSMDAHAWRMQELNNG